MKKTRRPVSLIKNVLASALAIAVFTQCSDEAKIEKDPVTVAAAETQTTTMNEDEAPVLSLTIDGTHTILSSTLDCKTCDYVVPENATVVDGKEIGIKPGQAICLNENFRYGNLKLINLEGDAKNPIIIAYGVNTPGEVASN